jgi:hypothetical protein
MSFVRLDPQDFLISVGSVVAPVWSNTSSAYLSSFTVDSVQENSDSGQYFINAINDGEVQFSVAYGHRYGSGSQFYYAGAPGLSPTKTVYDQFKNIVYGEDEGSVFNFAGYESVDFLAIVFARSRYKQALLPGSMQLNGIVGGVKITDNSAISTVVDYLNCGRVYRLGSGSFGDGIMPSSAANGSYGFLLPDIGTIILNPRAIGLTLNPGSNTTTTFPQNLITDIGDFYMNYQESIASDFVFVRARNAEFNYSCNPSFFQSSSLGTVLYPDFAQNPQTFITTIGLYNDNNELLAVAKLSKPLKKDFTKEALVRVKLDF